ncbi:MAG: hypothetical protein JW703_01160 [Candidatus Diapherotrites archaeon]|nr:hypothetical protein [Candidatus Diapherotrites archaeon]
MDLDNKAQVSVELIIVLASIVAVVLVIVSQLQKTASQGSKVIEDKTEDIFKKIDEID